MVIFCRTFYVVHTYCLSLEGGVWDLGWDLDETEDLEELLREAHKMMMDNARNLRGKGMMAGLDGGVSGQEG